MEKQKKIELKKEQYYKTLEDINNNKKEKMNKKEKKKSKKLKKFKTLIMQLSPKKLILMRILKLVIQN